MFFKKLTIQERMDKNKVKLINITTKRNIKIIESKIEYMVRNVKYSANVFYKGDEHFENEVYDNIVLHFNNQLGVTIKNKISSYGDRFFGIQISNITTQNDEL